MPWRCPWQAAAVRGNRRSLPWHVLHCAHCTCCGTCHGKATAVAWHVPCALPPYSMKSALRHELGLGLPWIAAACNGLPWIAVDCHGFPRLVMDYRGLRWIAMDSRGLPRLAIDCRGLPRLATACHAATACHFVTMTSPWE